MDMTLSHKMNQFKPSIFNELSHYKKRKEKEGNEIFDLSIGSPDLPPPSFVMDELAKGVQDPSQYGYSLTGIDAFHQSVAVYYKKAYEVQLQADQEVLMVMGSQDGLVHLPMVIVNPGDMVLVPDPGYTAYDAGIALADAQSYSMPLREENHFLPDLDAIPEVIREKAKLMILNFPGNPVPAVATKDFFEKVVQFAKKYNIVVLHDFAYSELYYGKRPISFLSIEGAKEVGIEFNSLSKSFNMAGCRIGYIVGNSTIVDGLNRLKSNLDYGVFLPIQQAAIKALQNASDFSEELRSVYKRRRDVFVKSLKELGWNVDIPQASMFVWAKIPKQLRSTDFTFRLMDETGIVVVPGYAFGKEGEDYVRIALTQDESVLLRAVSKLKESAWFTSALTREA
ncbi:hypothetical protein HNQ94_001582 [Salirhabdus euzebyi]|uniref:Aminotransferase n=1 Tax=Salirhabdus euzebyi TaxID=394506 RepID=A0A841Q413_9BACI|nr:LL-diaminopimelate aminotransferase [Salirhabdus euzebyi]MBB6453134.1 hypothetical protein [Salirhabdus euzebyi]